MGAEIIAFVLVAAIVVAASAYIIKAKKSGQKCIGCPDSKSCSGKCSECNSCSCGSSEK